MTDELPLLAYWAMDLAGRAGRHVFRFALCIFVVLSIAGIGAQALLQAFAAMGMVP